MFWSYKTEAKIITKWHINQNAELMCFDTLYVSYYKYKQLGNL